MESIGPKTIIIEFNGLPGSGKTTISKILKEKLTKDYGIEVKSRYARRSRHRKAYSILLCPRYYRLLISLNKYSKLYGTKRSFVRRLSIANFVREYYNFVFDNKKCALLIDQGIVQGIISFAHQDSLTTSEYLDDVLLNCGFEKLPIVIVNCNIDIEEAVKRLNQRPQNGCRVEKMSKENMLQTMKTQCRNFSIIRSLLESKFSQLIMIDINTDAFPEENAYRIIHAIQSKLISE